MVFSSLLNTKSIAFYPSHFKLGILFVFAEDLLVQEDLADLLPHVEQANDISQELDKKVLQF